MNSPPRYHLFLSVSSLSIRFSVMSVAQVLAQGPPAQLTGLSPLTGLHPTPPQQGRKGSAPGALSPAVPVNPPLIGAHPCVVELELILGTLVCLSRMCHFSRGWRWCPQLPDKPSFPLEAWQDARPCLGAGMEGQRPGLSIAAVPLGRRSLSCN